MFDLKKWVDNLHIAEDTKQLLKELIVRREKEQNLKAMLYGFSIINGFIIIMIVFWFMRFQAISHANMLGLLDYFNSSKAAKMFIFIAVSMFIIAAATSKEYKKKKEKYQNLREETARKLSATWKVNNDSKLKDEISRVLKAERDINIRYLK